MIGKAAENPTREAALGYPIIGITGPRQSGKTTLARELFPEKIYVSLENLDEKEYALSDLRGFLSHFENEGAILDEIQEV
jgi:uncharacterized protein